MTDNDKLRAISVLFGCLIFYAELSVGSRTAARFNPISGLIGAARTV